MTIFTKGDISVLFIHIPKTAGTSVERCFLDNGYEMAFRLGGPHGKRPPEERRHGAPPQHMHAALLEERLGTRDFAAIFCLVRHPLRRFESEYRFRRVSNHPLAQDGIDAFARIALHRFETRNPFVLDNHIRPQVDFPWRDCAVYRLEDGIDPALAAVSTRLPEPLKIAPHRAMATKPETAAGPSEDTLAALTRFYRADFDAFGYD